MEEELRRGRAMQAHLRIVRSDLETLGFALDDERGDRLRSHLGVERGEDHEDVRDRRVGDERLRAVDHVPLAVAARGRPETRGIASGARLGEAVRADRPRGEEIRQVARAQGVGPADLDGRAAEAGGSADHVPERRVRSRELFHGHAVAELAEALPADLLAEAETEETHAGHRVDHRARDLVLLLDLALERSEPLVHELPHGPLEHLELLG